MWLPIEPQEETQWNHRKLDSLIASLIVDILSGCIMHKSQSDIFHLNRFHKVTSYCDLRNNVYSKFGPYSMYKHVQFILIISVLSPLVSLSVHGVRVSVLPHQRWRHVCDILGDAGEQHSGVAVQPGVPIHLHLPLHLHGAVTLHRSHHWSLRDHQGRKLSWPKSGYFFQVFWLPEWSQSFRTWKIMYILWHSTKPKNPSTSQTCTPS